jgi:hypothetical protein
MLLVNSLLRRILAMKRHRTLDRGDIPVFTTEKIGPKRSMTPEGFMFCEDVPIARTGMMHYGPKETPIDTGPDGVAYVTRDASALFARDTLASFNGKPVVNDHPDVDVNPDNWQKLAVGVCMNVRRGTGADEDVILADLLLTDKQAIRDVKADKREVSAGYEADYEQLEPGRGRQANIIGNHIALVDRGRCGPRCAIGDHQLESTTMTKATQTQTRERRPLPEAVRKLFRDFAEELGNNPAVIPEDTGGSTDGYVPEGGPTETSSGGGGDTHIHIHAPGAGGAAPAAPDGVTDDGTMTQDDPNAGGDPIEQRLAALEAAVGQIMAMLSGGDDQGGDEGAPPTGDEDSGGGDVDETPPPDDNPTKDHAMTTDSAALETAFTSVVADAEILVPGFRIPTFDAKVTRKVTMDTMCALRKRVLEHLMTTQDGSQLVTSVNDGALFDAQGADCAAAAVVFRAAAGAKKAINNSKLTADKRPQPVVPLGAGPVGKITSLAQLNALYADLNAKASTGSK